MAHRLLEVIETEGRREREAILAQAETEAAGILEQARAESDRLLTRETPLPSPPPPDPGLAEERIAFLTTYWSRVADLQARVMNQLSLLGEEIRPRLLAGVVAEILLRLGPGIYRFKAPAEVWSRLEEDDRIPGGRNLRWERGEGSEIALHSKDGRMSVCFSEETLVQRYFAAEASRVARLLLGDDYP
jgi:hypothetical protein